MRTGIAVVLAAGVVAGSMAFAKGVTPEGPKASDVGDARRDDKAPLIQLAILLDTSNSMDGLIDQARSQLWKIVNDLARARRDGAPARFEVALYEYGNTRLTPASGWVRRVLAFTTDLDRVSEELFALKTNGGDEYCGTVLQASLDELEWSTADRDLRVVFIAGNEPFTQGPVDFHPVCRRAHQKGIFVNTVHCGTLAEGATTGWRDGAVLADGAFAAIDMNRAVVHVEAPQDAEIARLGMELNKTYLPYGSVGEASRQRQVTQDTYAQQQAGGLMSRSVTKANRLYSNSGWDLVDAVREGRADVTKLEKEALPAEMRGLTPQQRKDLVAAKAKERAGIQEQINTLNAARERHVAAVRARSARKDDDSLDGVMTAALRAQAATKGIALD
jgi:hypothetical protein